MLSRGIDPGMLALMNNSGFGGENGIWGVIYLAIICSIFGWNGNGDRTARAENVQYSEKVPVRTLQEKDGRTYEIKL